MSKERDVRRLFAEHGYVIIALRRNGHWNVRASRDGQPPRLFTVAVSPSDWRARKNLIASLNRGHPNWGGTTRV
jgi:hypothetical protein